MKKLVLFVIIMIFFALLAALVKTYLDMRATREYVNFITDRTNNIILKIDEINGLINEISFDTEGQYIENLNTKKIELQNLYSNTNNERAKYKKLYRGDQVEKSFDQYLESVRSLIESYNTLIESIKNLEDKELYEEKLSEYISKSNEIQSYSESLEEELNKYIENYSKFDFNRIVDAIKFI